MMPVLEDAFTALLIKPAVFVLITYVIAALLGAMLGAEGFFFANFVTFMTCIIALPLYFRRDLARRFRRPRFAPSRPL